MSTIRLDLKRKLYKPIQMTPTNLWRNAILSLLLLFNFTNSKAQFGSGSFGSVIISSPNTIINEYTEVTNIDFGTFMIDVNQSSYFSVGKKALLIQMDGGNAGAWEWVHIIQVNPGAVRVLNINNPMDPITGIVQLISVPDYADLTVTNTGSVVPLTWNGTIGGVVVMMVSGVLTIEPGGTIDATGDGFQSGSPGALGQGGQGGAGGIAPGGNGGNFGVVSNSGIGGGGDGGWQGDNGMPGGLAVQNNCQGCAAGAYNAGSASSNLLMMGGAGYSGDGGNGNLGAGGGGAGSDGTSNGADGTAGGNGGDGGAGGIGGAGGGIIIVAAHTLDLPSQACMLANGENGALGQDASLGGNGGDGGLGGGGCTVGGGGGGGNGGFGGDGGGGGSGGAGGMIKIIRNNSSPAPLGIHREVNGGLGANGGSGAIGGLAGNNAGNLNGMTCLGSGSSGGGGGSGSGGTSGTCHAGIVLALLEDMGIAGSNNGTYTNLGNGFHVYNNGTESLYIEEINPLMTLVHVAIGGNHYYTIVTGSGSMPSPFLTLHEIFTQGTVSYPSSQSGLVSGSLGTYTADCTGSRSFAQNGQAGADGPDGVDAGPGDVSDDLGIDCNLDPMIVLVDTPVPFICPETPAEIQASVISGGAAPYTFTYVNPNIIDQNTTGTFQVDDTPGEIIVTDANGCVSEVTPATADVDLMFLWYPLSTMPSCFGVATGQLVLELDQSYDPFAGFIADVYYVSDIFNINTYYPTSFTSTTITFDGLAPGQYFIYQEQCFFDPLLTFEILESPEIEVTPTITNAVCDVPGSIELTMTGGIPSYTVLWGNGQTNNPLNGLFAQNISATVTDAQGCTFTNTYAVGGSSSPMTVSFSNAPEVCAQSNGSSQAIVSGGMAPYTYLWSNGTTSALIQNVSAGNYNLQITDAEGCLLSASTTITGVGDSPTITGQINNVTCYGVADGDVTISVNGGTEPYTYQWSTGSTTTSNQNGNPGIYSVVVTSFDGCTANANYEITQPDQITIQGTTTQPGCLGGNGSIDVTVTGGVTASGYDYSWSNGSTTEDIMSLTPGTYSLVVTDDNGCTASATFSILPSSPPLINSMVTNDFCGNSGGAIDLSVTSSSLPLQFQWSNGATTEDLTNLPAGYYTVTVTDATMCTSTSTVPIYGPFAPLSVSTLQIIHLNCFGDNNGSVFTTITGGEEPYNFAWSNGTNGQHLIGVGAGTYTLTVTDNRGCQQTGTFTVTQPSSALQVALTGVTVVCSGQTGIVMVTGVGGTAPYYGEGPRTVYSGLNQITLYDSQGCVTTAPWFVAAVANPLVTLNATPDCGGSSTGTITSLVTNGTPSYSYLWNNGAISPNLSSLPGGDYTLNVTDAYGCVAEGKVHVPGSPAMNLSGQVTDAFCSPSNSGAIDLNINGGTPTYFYSWSNGSSTEDLSNITAGNYSITVTDQYGCTANNTFNVGDGCLCPVNFNAEICGPSEICQGENFTLISQVTPRPQGYPVTYSWTRTPATFSATTASITQNGLPAGSYTYTLVVTYSPICTVTVQHTVLVRARPTITVTNALTNASTLATQLAGCDIILNSTGGTYYNWTYAGNTFATHTNQLIDANTIITTASQTRTYGVVGIDQYGCSNSASIQVRLVPLTITAAYSAAPAGPNVTVSGNIPTVYTNATFTWTGPGGYISGPSTTIRNFSRVGLLSGLVGTYTATVVQNGCTKTATFLLNESAQIIKSLILESGDVQTEIISNDHPEMQEESTTGILEKIEEPQFELFPNPSNNYIQLTGRTEFPAYTMMKIFDPGGNLIMDFTIGEKQDFSETIDISGLSSGNYIITLDCGANGTWNKVFTKEN